MLLKLPNNSLEQPFIMKIRNRIQRFKRKVLIIFIRNPGSVTQAIKRVNLQIKIWLQSVNQNMVRCAIWYHLCNLKNVKNTHGGVLILVKL